MEHEIVVIGCIHHYSDEVFVSLIKYCVAKHPYAYKGSGGRSWDRPTRHRHKNYLPGSEVSRCLSVFFIRPCKFNMRASSINLSSSLNPSFSKIIDSNMMMKGRERERAFRITI